MHSGPWEVPLVCFPFAGSGASFFRLWRKLDVARETGVTVVPLQLPGREERFGESLPTDLIATAEGLAADVVRIGEDEGKTVALFGHSLGALLAYETAREVARTHPGLVSHLFVSGSPGPRQGRIERASGLSDDEFLARVAEFAGYRHAAFDEPGLRELLLPVLRADVAMHEDYCPASDEPVDISITALRGAEDGLVSRAQAEQWRTVTTARFTTAEIPGGHMYLTDHPSALMEQVGRSLRPHGEFK